MALIQSKKLKPAAQAVLSSAGHHGAFAAKNVKEVSHPVNVFTNVAWLQRKNQRPVDVLDTTDFGQPGLNVLAQTVPLSFAEAVLDVDHVKVSVVIWTRFKMSNVTLKDVATITHGPTGALAVPLAVPVIKNVPSLIAMV